MANREAQGSRRPDVKRRVAVLFGGRSAEHEISCISARSVVDALDPERNEVVLVGITREGRWHLLGEVPSLASGSGGLPEVAEHEGTAVELAAAGEERALVDAEGARRAVDVVLPVLHGPYGEDGAIQGLLDLAGVPYVGAGVLGSALGMDKAVQKVLFAAAGLPVAPYQVVFQQDWEEDPEGVEARAEALGYPVFVKPANLGSSVGVSKAKGSEALAEAIDEAFGYSRKAVIERAIEPAREIECAVMGNDDPVASVPGEVVPEGHEFYDYEAKYLDEHGARLVIPAQLVPAAAERIQRMSISAFRAIDCAGMARVDFFLSGEELWLNEINTIPGFTSISMYPKLWEASGIGYGELIERLLDLAVERHESRGSKAASPRELGP
jgi:D-alanine-D-alanine ligase